MGQCLCLTGCVRGELYRKQQLDAGICGTEKLDKEKVYAFPTVRCIECVLTTIAELTNIRLVARKGGRLGRPEQAACSGHGLKVRLIARAQRAFPKCHFARVCKAQR